MWIKKKLLLYGKMIVFCHFKSHVYWKIINILLDKKNGILRYRGRFFLFWRNCKNVGLTAKNVLPSIGRSHFLTKIFANDLSIMKTFYAHENFFFLHIFFYGPVFLWTTLMYMSFLYYMSTLYISQSHAHLEFTKINIYIL